MILARTLKGKGVSFVEGKDGWHGKPFKKGEELDRAIAELEKQFVPARAPRSTLAAQIPKPPSKPRACRRPKPLAPPAYTLGDRSRRAKPTARRSPSSAKPIRASSRSTPTSRTRPSAIASRRSRPSASIQNFIAEQVMVGAAMGLAARGAIPFPSTFACFLTRAADFVRMAAISNVGIKLAGSHAGVSIGEDGPSQMALEIWRCIRAEPNYTVLYPCDAVSAERLLALMAYHPGPAYMRTSRPKTPVIYANDETFTIGG
jgi:transketolase